MRAFDVDAHAIEEKRWERGRPVTLTAGPASPIQALPVRRGQRLLRCRANARKCAWCISAISSLLFHWRVLPLIVQGFARVLERTMAIGGRIF